MCDGLSNSTTYNQIVCTKDKVRSDSKNSL